jgi:hypothetical protein
MASGKPGAVHSLFDTQRNVRQLRLEINRHLNSDSETKERLQDLSRITGRELNAWSEPEVISWLNEKYLRRLDPALSLSALSLREPCMASIQGRKADEERRIGVDLLKSSVSTITTIYLEHPKDHTTQSTGTLVDFEKAVRAMLDATILEQQERARSKKAIFKAVWDAAKGLLEDTTQDIDACPVCDTPLDQTSKRGREEIILHISGQLCALESYRRAQEVARDAGKQVEVVLNKLRQQVAKLQASLRAAGYVDPNPALVATETYSLALANWSQDARLPDSLPLKLSLSSVKREMEGKIQDLQNEQGEMTYGKVMTLIENLIILKSDIDRIRAVRAETSKLHASLSVQESFISSEIKSYFQSVIDELKGCVNNLYKSIHAIDNQPPPAVTLELADDRQPKLELLVDFAPNRSGAVPSGYLSDSQIHTLALSLRLAAIRLLNTAAPLVILDDVVTSYDADHRKAIAAMLADHFGDFQVILVTHDERFFCYLNDHLSEASWCFRRIVNIDPDFGPCFHEHRVTSDMIAEKWDNGESAANEIRQAEEEWLLNKAREFGVDVRIRDIHRAFSYERGELARAIAGFLKKTEVILPPISGHANSFLCSLQRGDVENFGSHFQDNPQAWSSIGDERTRWREFTEFCTAFVCQKCGRKRFKRPVGVKRAICYYCETPFSFELPACQRIAGEAGFELHYKPLLS